MYLMVALVTGVCSFLHANPKAMMSPADLETIRTNLDRSASFSKYLNRTKTRIDRYFETQPDIPEPKDPGGGYTHEQHKKNGIAIYEAGMLYAFTGEERFINYVRDALTAYAELYPTLNEHPAKRSSYPGRMFWQVLNESVWLVYSIQGYDAIRADLSPSERDKIESGLFHPMVHFLSVDSEDTFNRIHNHAAWAAAAVGITGYVLGEVDYVNRSIQGANYDGKTGFLALIDNLFSPSGYYTEGPYYQRYALMPFVVFARTIQSNDPDFGIFDYKDGVLLKAILTCIDLSYNGLFFPINDAIKDKGLNTVELRYGIAIAYALTQNPQLLDIAKLHNGSFVPTADSLYMAIAMDEGKSERFEYKTRLVKDGPNGNRGGLGILRGELTHSVAVLKATSHGFGHGHFDRLNWFYYDNGNEIVTDYGAVRFLNIEQKEGGRYLPENTSWAKQTVAHNTLVVNESSQFDGEVKQADLHHPTVTQFLSSSQTKLVRADTSSPYQGVHFDRLLALFTLVVGKTLVVDIMSVKSQKPVQLDLPVHFAGAFIDANTSPTWQAVEAQRPLGDSSGYQYLWLRSRYEIDKSGVFSVTWLNENRFYTMTTTANAPSEVLFTRLGANDPNFNLRPEQSFLRRVHSTNSTTFVSVMETHGEYNGAEEFTVNNRPLIQDIELFESEDAQVIKVVQAEEQPLYLAFSRNSDPRIKSSLIVDDIPLSWDGYAAIIRKWGD